jgi:hypothetical protein
MVKAQAALAALVVILPLFLAAAAGLEVVRVAIQLMVLLEPLQLVVTAAAVLTHFMGMVWVVAVQYE